MENRAVGDSIGEKAECKCDVFTWFRKRTLRVPPIMACVECCKGNELINEREESVIDIRPEPSIYRVPKQLRKVNKEAYTPKLVSIGPFHHRRKELRDMKKHKLRYLEDFLKRTTGKKNQQDLKRIIEAKEEEIRHCYSDCGLESDEFVKMILLDAIFIIELFLKSNSIEEAQRKEKKAAEEKDYIFSKPWLENGISFDLILLENQLPFFVLEDLYTSASNDSSSLGHQQEVQQIKEQQGDLNKEHTPSFLELSCSFFISHYDIINNQENPNISEKVKHFTDLLRYFFCSPELKHRGDQSSLYSATKLDEAGLQFEPVNDGRRLLAIRFPENKWLKYCPCFNLSWLLSCLPCFQCFRCLKGMGRFLEVPCFVVDDDTECLFRNLMALEQCYYPSNAYICNYVMLLDYLIDTEEDVALLVEKKVITNQLGSNAVVADLINKLCKEIMLVGSCYFVLAKELNDYCENAWNRNMAFMTNVYFRNFWRGTATFVGLFILFFQFWDFLQSILEMKKKWD